MKIADAPSTPIIVIDDDDSMRRACEAALRRAGYQVETCADGVSGLKRIEESHPSVLILDLKMPGMGGMEVIARLREIDTDIIVVVITGFATVGTAVEAMKAGAYDFLPKPFTAEELRAIISRAVERYRLGMEAKRLRQEKEGPGSQLHHVRFTPVAIAAGGSAAVPRRAAPPDGQRCARAAA